jgi:hypothetical protein
LTNNTEVLPKKIKKQKIIIKQQVIDNFNKVYAENCDNKKMSRKMRGFS